MREQLERIDAMTVPTDALAALVQLDQAHPNDFGVKFRLGELYLKLGQLDVSVVYLRRAHELGGDRHAPKDAARLAMLEYARALILLGKPADAIPVVASAAAAGDAAALLVRARARAQSGNSKAALADFRAAWDARDAPVSAADYTLYAQVLAAEVRYAEGLKILRECEQSLGYQPGTGLLESSILERLGLAGQSILAAFKETLYQETQGAISRDQIDKNLSTLAVRSDVAGMTGVNQQLLIRGLKWYLHAQWADASRSLAQGLKGIDDPFARYLLLACSLEKDAVTVQALAEFAALETRYRNFPDFYYHLWRGMKKGPGAYSLANVRSVLEKMILLAPTSGAAMETRVELGRLLDVDPEDAKHILLPAELDRAYARLESGADPVSILPPVLRLLSIRRENVYTSDGVLMLKSAAKLPAVSAYLADQAKHADGALKDRLEQLL